MAHAAARSSRGEMATEGTLGLVAFDSSRARPVANSRIRAEVPVADRSRGATPLKAALPLKERRARESVGLRPPKIPLKALRALRHRKGVGRPAYPERVISRKFALAVRRPPAGPLRVEADDVANSRR
jgi:hypothetical protein